jgi:hypothetical protein
MRNEPMSEAEEDAQIWCYTRRGDTLFPVADLETTGWDRTSQGKGGGDGLVGKCAVHSLRRRGNDPLSDEVGAVCTTQRSRKMERGR